LVRPLRQGLQRPLAGDDRALDAEGLHPVLIDAGVGAADAGGGDLQQQLVAARLRDRQLFHPCVLRPFYSALLTEMCQFCVKTA
jgi:hypothetical protein